MATADALASSQTTWRKTMRAEGCGASALPVPIVSVGSAASVRLGTRLAVQGGRQAEAPNDCVAADRREPSETEAAQRFGDVHGVSGLFGLSQRWSLPGGGDHPKRKGRDRSGQGVDTPQEIAVLCSYVT